MTVEFSAGAVRQIDAILTYVGQESPQGKARIEARIMRAARMIEANPESGTSTDRKNVRRVVLTPFPYVLFYRLIGNRIIVQRVRHTSRRP